MPHFGRTKVKIITISVSGRDALNLVRSRTVMNNDPQWLPTRTSTSQELSVEIRGQNSRLQSSKKGDRDKIMTTATETGQYAAANALPQCGLLRLWQILGDQRRGVPPIIPISKSSWWAGVKSGKYPKPVKLSARCTCWHVDDIRMLIERKEKL